MIAALKRRFFPVSPVLFDYVQPKNARWIRLRNALFVTILIIVGLFYGMLTAIFPVFLYLYLLLPLGILAILVVWALPEARSFPEALIERLLFAFLVAIFMWPNYLAISLPGLPWITVNRLITFPMAVVFLISLSISKRLRSELKAVLASNKPIMAAFFVYLAAQTYTLAFAESVSGALNRYIDAQTQWTATFFIAAWLFTKDGRARKFMRLFSITAVIMVVLATIEWKLGYVPWRDHIPSFLKVPDESVQRTLSGQRRGGVNIYRVQGTFSTSVNLAEYLSFTFAIGYFWLLSARSVALRVAVLGYFAYAFFVIILTDSRTGPVCVFAATFGFALFWTLRRWRLVRRGVLAPFIVVMYPISIVIFLALSRTWNRLKVMTWGGGQHQASTDTRMQQWDNFWPAIARWPFGYGIGQGASKAGTINGDGVFTLDSYYILTFLNYGVIGGVAYYTTFFLATWGAFRHGSRALGEDANALLVAGTLMIAFLVSKGVLIQDDSHGAVFIALGMIAALIHRAKRAEQAEQDQETALIAA